jgi:hypothetical protein
VAKSSGTLREARIAVQAFDAAYKQVAFINLTDAVNVADGKEFSAEVRLPASTRTLLSRLFLMGMAKSGWTR